MLIRLYEESLPVGIGPNQTSTHIPSTENANAIPTAALLLTHQRLCTQTIVDRVFFGVGLCVPVFGFLKKSETG